MLFYFEPAAMCDLPSGLILAPLPGQKQLWEAKDALAWEVESQKLARFPVSFGVAADGNLIKLSMHDPCIENAITIRKSLHTGSPTVETASWEEWCSGMDEFGGLIMLAASLLG